MIHRLKLSTTTKYDLFILFNICLLGLVLRLWGLSTKEFWYDEAYTGILATLPADQFIKLFNYDIHPPIYINLIRIWTYLFGNSDYTIRLFSVIAGVLLIPTSYLFSKNLNISQKHPFFKFVIPLVFAVNPFFVEYSKEARSYSLTALVFSLFFTSYYIAHKYGKFNLKWAVTVLLMAATFLTHYFSVLGIIFIFLFDTFYTKTKTITFKKYFLQKIKLYFCLGAVFSTLIGTFLPTILTQYRNAPVLWWIPNFEPQRLLTSVYIFLFGVKTNTLGVPPTLSFFPSISAETIGFFIFSVFLSGVVYLFSKLKGYDKKDLSLLLNISVLPIISLIILQLLKPHIFLERYLTPYAIFFVVLFFIIIFKLKRILKYFLVTSYVLASVFLIVNVNYEPQGFARLAQELEKVKTKNTQVIFADPISFTIAKYYLAKNPNVTVRIYNPREKYDDWEIISQGEVLKNYEELDNKQRLFVFNNSKKPDIWFRQSAHIGSLYIYSTLPIFPKDLALKDQAN